MTGESLSVEAPDGAAPHEQVVGIASPTWGVIGACVGGALAKAGTKPMQDACAAAVGGPGEVFLAVADGARNAGASRRPLLMRAVVKSIMICTSSRPSTFFLSETVAASARPCATGCSSGNE